MAYAIIRLAKHSSNGSLGGMTKHNQRTIDVPNCDPALTKSNIELMGSGDYVADVNKAIESSGALYQKNSVKAIEHVITASPEFFEENKRLGKDGQYNNQKFIHYSKEFLQEFYGEHSKITSMSLHLDEKSPHLHCFVVPITKGKLKGGREVKRVGAKKFLDGRKKLSGMQDLFAEKMKPLGLERGIHKSKAQHTTVKEYYSSLTRAVEFTEMNKIKAPKIETLPPAVMGREAWLEEQNKLIQQQLNNSIEKMNRLMADKTFLNSSEKLQSQKLTRIEKSTEKALEKLKFENNQAIKTKDSNLKDAIGKHNKLVADYNQRAQQMRTLISDRDGLRKKLDDRLTNLKARERELKDLLHGKLPPERIAELKQEFRQAEERQSKPKGKGPQMG